MDAQDTKKDRALPETGQSSKPKTKVTETPCTEKSEHDVELVDRKPPKSISHENGPCRWVGASSSNCDIPGAFVTGKDQDGNPIYAGRAYHKGDTIPANVIPSKKGAFVSYGGQEIFKNQFEVMCARVFSWQPASGDDIPQGAVKIGNTADGEILYIGRVEHQGYLAPGKVHKSHGRCYFPFNGKEIDSTTYEILVLK